MVEESEKPFRVTFRTGALENGTHIMFSEVYHAPSAKTAMAAARSAHNKMITVIAADEIYITDNGYPSEGGRSYDLKDGAASRHQK